MIKAAFFDIDGTLLLNPEGTVPPGTWKALRLLRDAGVLVVLATGRALSELEGLPCRDFPFDGYVMLNGQMACDADRRIVFSQPIEGEALRHLVNVFDSGDLPVFLVDAQGHFINYVNDLVRDTLRQIAIVVPPEKPYCGQPVFMGGAYVSAEDEAALQARLPELEFSRWHTGGVDIICKGSGKEVGVEAWLRAQGLGLADACAFGDGGNDVGMLRAVGLGIAMGNGTPAAKEAANVVTASVREDGVLKAVQEQVLPRIWPWPAGAVLTVGDRRVTVRRLLGRGKGGYSFLVDDGDGPAVLKQIHHEPCDYYSFGDKMASELRDYERLRAAGIPVPQLRAADTKQERLLKDYVEGPTALDLALEGGVPDELWRHVQAMAARAKDAGLNIDYFPTNFVAQDGQLWYVDYECNPYDPRWSLEAWGAAYWSVTPELEAWLAENRPAR